MVLLALRCTSEEIVFVVCVFVNTTSPTCIGDAASFRHQPTKKGATLYPPVVLCSMLVCIQRKARENNVLRYFPPDVCHSSTRVGQSQLIGEGIRSTHLSPNAYNTSSLAEVDVYRVSNVWRDTDGGGGIGPFLPSPESFPRGVCLGGSISLRGGIGREGGARLPQASCAQRRFYDASFAQAEPGDGERGNKVVLYTFGASFAKRLDVSHSMKLAPEEISSSIQKRCLF